MAHSHAVQGLVCAAAAALLFFGPATAVAGGPAAPEAALLQGAIDRMPAGDRPMVVGETAGPMIVFPDPEAALALGAGVCAQLRPPTGKAVVDLDRQVRLPDASGGERTVMTRILVGPGGEPGTPGSPDGAWARTFLLEDTRPGILIIACGGRGGDGFLKGAGGRGGDLEVRDPGRGAGVIVLGGPGGDGADGLDRVTDAALRAGRPGGDGGDAIIFSAAHTKSYKAPPQTSVAKGGNGGAGGAGGTPPKAGKGGRDGKPGKGAGSAPGGGGGGGGGSSATNGGGGGGGGGGGSALLTALCEGQRLDAYGGNGGKGGKGGAGRKGIDPTNGQEIPGHGGGGGGGGGGGWAEAYCQPLWEYACAARARAGDGGKGGWGGSGDGKDGQAGAAGDAGWGGLAMAEACCPGNAIAIGGDGGDPGGRGGKGCPGAKGGRGGDGGLGQAVVWEGTTGGSAYGEGGDAGDGGGGGFALPKCTPPNNKGGAGGDPGNPGAGIAMNFCPGGTEKTKDGASGRPGADRSR